MKKKNTHTDETRVEEENKRRRYHWQSLGDGGPQKKKKKKSIDNLGNAERTSAAAEKGEIDEEGGWRTKRWEDEAGGGQRRARS